jgi:hypothetical protein
MNPCGIGEDDGLGAGVGIGEWVGAAAPGEGEAFVLTPAAVQLPPPDTATRRTSAKTFMRIRTVGFGAGYV